MKGGGNRVCGTVEKTWRIDSFEVFQWSGSIWLILGDGSISGERLSYRIYYGECNEYIVLSFDDKPVAEIDLVIVNGVHLQKFFQCPMCGKKRRFLYLKNGGFGCRTCKRLNYKKQQIYRDSLFYYDQGRKFAAEKLDCIITECPADFPSVTPAKPKGMHRATYERLMKKFKWYQAQYERCYNEELTAILSRELKTI